MEMLLILALLVFIGAVGLYLVRFVATVEESFHATFLFFVGEAGLILALGGAVALLVRAVGLLGGA